MLLLLLLLCLPQSCHVRWWSLRSGDRWRGSLRLWVFSQTLGVDVDVLLLRLLLLLRYLWLAIMGSYTIEQLLVCKIKWCVVVVYFFRGT